MLFPLTFKQMPRLRYNVSVWMECRLTLDAIQGDLRSEGPAKLHYKAALLSGSGSQGSLLNNRVPNVESYFLRGGKLEEYVIFSFSNVTEEHKQGTDLDFQICFLPAQIPPAQGNRAISSVPSS